MTAEKMTNEINKWLGQYCNNTDEIDNELAAKYPLRECKVKTEAVPGKPGMFKSEVQMRPHFKLKGVEVSLTMVGQFDTPSK